MDAWVPCNVSAGQLSGECMVELVDINNVLHGLVVDETLVDIERGKVKVKVKEEGETMALIWVNAKAARTRNLYVSRNQLDPII